MTAAKRAKSTPRLRFPEFRAPWAEKEIGQFLAESRIPGSNGSIAKKLTVKLWGNGVFGKVETIKGSASTQYYKRRAGQFIYSKLDFLNQAFGIVPDFLDGFESTVDLPCFDVCIGLDPRFLLEYVQRRNFYRLFGEIADGGRKAKRIQVEAFLSFPIAVPKKIAEQQKIADCLTSLDEVIAAQERKVEALKAHKRGLMQQLFPREGETVPRLRFPEFRDAPEWELKTLKRICDMQAGKFVQASEIAEKRANGMFPCYGGNGLRGYTTTFTHSGGYPLIGRQGALCGNVQYARGDFHATEHALVASAKPTIDVDWLYYTLAGLNLNRFATGQAQPGLSVDVLNGVECAVPNSEKEQQRISDCLSSLDARLTAESNQLASLKTHKQGLMQQLFPSPDTD